MLKKTLITAALIAALAVLASPAAFPQGTPDGETPAQETVCELESGAAFGLCNAYCEAMDCHLPDDENPTGSPNASETACMKVYDKFMQHTGRVPPCESSPPVCGDGNLDLDEECDDGNIIDGDGCSAVCTLEAVNECEVDDDCEDGQVCDEDGMCVENDPT